jgi:peptidoglycan/xylan/chitin deacetylase (PgdA/CDA1 family)
MLNVTTSWDDGDMLDTKLTALLDKYGIKGTFYITQKYREQRLTDESIKMLAVRHEVGAHTLTHPDLRNLSEEEQKKEIAGGKEWLESILGKEVKMFCYPSGRVGDDSKFVVKEAGFKGARTVEQGVVSTVGDPFLMPTTIQVYPFPFRKKDANSFYWRKLFQPLQQRGPIFKKLGVSMIPFRSWQSLARASFGIALKSGQTFHLWGHSWEIEKYDMWDELESFLKYISNRSDCQYLTNGDMIGRQ